MPLESAAKYRIRCDICSNYLNGPEWQRLEWLLLELEQRGWGVKHNNSYFTDNNTIPASVKYKWATYYCPDHIPAPVKEW